MELTSKQKKQLRGLGQGIEAAATVGKAGLTQGVVEGISILLGHQELLKVRIPTGSGDQRQQMGDDLAARTNSALIGVVGRTVLLYRENPDLPPEKRLHF